MPAKKFVFLAAMIRSLGPQLTWKVRLIQRQLYQIELPINPELRLHFNEMTDQEYMLQFRFGHLLIQLLVSKLGFPDVIVIPEHNDQVLAVEAFCLLLHRLAYPNHWFYLKGDFGRHASSMGHIFHYIMHFILQ
jgi:hypothetical protein